MKIALLSYEYPPETGFGGIGTYTWAEARALVKLGHEVHVLAGFTEPTELRESEHDGVRVFRYRARGRWMNLFKRLEKANLWWTKTRLETALSMRRGMRRLLEKYDYEVMELPECGAEGMLINGRIGIPSVIKFQSPARLIMPMYDLTKADHRFCGMVEQYGINRADVLTSSSHFLAKEAHAKLGVKQEIDVTHTGIDVDLFDSFDPSGQVDLREKYGIPRDRLIILFSGRLERRKGIHTMKDVVADVLARHDAAFVFAGWDLFDYAEKEMKPYFDSKDLRGSYHFVGQLDHRGVRSALLQADLFIIPSIWDNCPNSCLEAMAAGLPIVSSDAGGLPELIRHEQNGLIAATEDAAAFTRCLERLLEDSALRDRLGRAARQSIETEFTDIRMAEKNLVSYRKAISKAS